jgi:hypothetical protein
LPSLKGKGSGIVLRRNLGLVRGYESPQDLAAFVVGQVGQNARGGYELVAHKAGVRRLRPDENADGVIKREFEVSGARGMSGFA